MRLCLSAGEELNVKAADECQLSAVQRSGIEALTASIFLLDLQSRELARVADRSRLGSGSQDTSHLGLINAVSLGLDIGWVSNETVCWAANA